MPSDVRYDMLPEHMQSGARLYIEDGIMPGDFLMSVLANDLKGAFGRADTINREAMFTWASWLYNECPMQANGSIEKVTDWVRKGGMKQYAAAETEAAR